MTARRYVPKAWKTGDAAATINVAAAALRRAEAAGRLFSRVASTPTDA